MNNRKVILAFQITSIIFTIILGTLLHFTYEWSNKNLLVAIVSAINESTWEHLKLLFFPMLITTVIGYFYIGKNIPNFICAKTRGIIIAMLFTITFYYTYTGIIGNNFAIINILIFFIATILGEYRAYKKMINNVSCNNKVAVIIIISLLVFFVFFTYFTPQIGLFKDPINNKYGIDFIN